jgi:hypothetical protein
MESNTENNILSEAEKILASELKKKKLLESIDKVLQLTDEDLSNTDPNTLLEMRKSVNPYGNTIEGTGEHYLNLSITNMTEEWIKKYITTSMIGFLFRMTDEWKVPQGIPVVGVYEYLEDNKLLDTPEGVKDKSAEYDYELNREYMKKRIIVKEFLEEMFQFNPDEHVRSSYKENVYDKDRTPLNTMAARIAKNHHMKKDKKFKSDIELKETLDGTLKNKKIKKILRNKKTGETKEIIEEIKVRNEPPVDPLLPSSREKLDEEKPVDNDLLNNVYNIIPPHDIYGNFNRYMEENYDSLRTAMTNLYCDKPDFEYAINPYSWHDTAEDAEKFVKQHRDEVISSIVTVRAEKWNLLAKWKANTDKINYYNKNTMILEEMINQMKKDEELGAKYMEKRIEKNKKKNIMEHGKESENFKKWKTENKDGDAMGAIKVDIDDECPDDALEIPVWKIAKGGKEITKSKIYTLAEPLNVAK